MASGSLTLVVHPDHPEPRKIAMAAQVLVRDGVGLYPTDTVYALGCGLGARKSVERLYRLKRMDERQPLALLCPDLREAARYAVVTDFAYRQLRRLLPGPYTVVLDATREVPRLLLDKRRTIGIRIPDSKICTALTQALGGPLLTTSATPPGSEHACRDVEEAKHAWPTGIDLFLDGGLLPNEPSTIVSLVGDQIEVLREGLGPIDGVLA